MFNEADDSGVLILDWSRLTPDEINDRLDWLRKSLVAGEDWGYCEEYLTCVLKNQEASTMYKFGWFESGNQTYVDKPSMLKTKQLEPTPLGGN